MSQDRRTLSVLLALAVVALARWGYAQASEAPSDVRRAPEERACSPAATARAAGLEIGTVIASDWRIESIRCAAEDDCTRVVLSLAPDELVVRLCPHVEGGPRPVATLAGSDVFYAVPARPLADDTITSLVAAVVARLGASEGE